MCDLVPWPGIEPRLPALGAWRLSHWAIREVPASFYVCFNMFLMYNVLLVIYLCILMWLINIYTQLATSALKSLNRIPGCRSGVRAILASWWVDGEKAGVSSWFGEAKLAFPLLSSRGQKREAKNNLGLKNKRTQKLPKQGWFQETLQNVFSPHPSLSLLNMGVRQTSYSSWRLGKNPTEC